MARCGCGAGCSCVVQADPDSSIVVTGVGSATNPYVVGGNGGKGGEIILDFGDVIYVGPSKAFYAKEPLTLTNVLAHVVVPPTADIEVDVLRNGVTVDALTLPATDTFIELPGLSIAYADGDTWQMRVTNAGAGGSGLVCQGTFS